MTITEDRSHAAELRDTLGGHGLRAIDTGFDIREQYCLTEAKGLGTSMLKSYQY